MPIKSLKREPNYISAEHAKAGELYEVMHCADRGRVGLICELLEEYDQDEERIVGKRLDIVGSENCFYPSSWDDVKLRKCQKGETFEVC